MTLFNPIIDVKHKPYCGPAAVSLLTGVPVSRVEHMICRCRGGGYRNTLGKKIPIKGTYTWELVKVLKRLGCKVQEFKVTESTLAKFVDDTRHAGTFLVNVTGHIMTCRAGQVADSTHQSPIAIEAYHKGQRRVQRAWKVLAPLLPKYGPDDQLVVATRAPKPKRDVKEVRAEKVRAATKKWERKEKLAKTKLKKLRSQLKRYEKLGVLSKEKQS